MTTLVIHPFDSSTAFLKKVYENRNCTVIDFTIKISKSKLRELIRTHDRIVCLGHGTEKGLIHAGRLVIDSTFVQELRAKTDNVFIWCNADAFVKKYKLNAVCTGMIISEFDESLQYCISTTALDLQFNNELFAEALRRSIAYTGNVFVESMLQIYRQHDPSFRFINDSQVLDFNRQQIFAFA